MYVHNYIFFIWSDILSNNLNFVIDFEGPNPNNLIKLFLTLVVHKVYTNAYNIHIFNKIKLYIK